MARKFKHKLELDKITANLQCNVKKTLCQLRVFFTLYKFSESWNCFTLFTFYLYLSSIFIYQKILKQNMMKTVRYIIVTKLQRIKLQFVIQTRKFHFKCFLHCIPTVKMASEKKNKKNAINCQKAFKNLSFLVKCINIW